MWGIVPAAGVGSRIQPLAFSKELLPVGSRFDGTSERPKAVSEYLIERMIAGGAEKICMVISPGKSDIINYYGGSVGDAEICYVIQQRASGLCDAIFRVRSFIAANEQVLIGLPDTIWFPENGYALLDDDALSFLCFRVDRPELFDAVVLDEEERVLEIQVKQQNATSHWIWGAFKMNGSILAELHDLWLERNRTDEYFGTLVNAWLARGNTARAVRRGESYVDVGTLNGYREASRMLAARIDHSLRAVQQAG
jgi:glucose-1-phosphate thymidylyltransferase